MKTIKEKNRMIAEFMGYETYEQTDNVAIRLMDGNEFNSTDIGHVHAKFHTSWDWLMPVIKEISNKTGYVYVMYGTDSYFTNMGDSFYFGGGFESIEETHIAVVQFIEWYNRLTDET